MPGSRIASGRIRRRLALAILLTALIPLIASWFYWDRAIRVASERFYRPEVGERLDEALALYQELARAAKTSMRYEAVALAADPELARAAASRDAPALERTLRAALGEFPNLAAITIETAKVEGQPSETIASVNREAAIDPIKEHQLVVTRPLGPALTPTASRYELVATFVAEKSQFVGLEEMGNFVNFYRNGIEKSREETTRGYIYGFAVLLGFTLIGAIGVGALLARSVSSRLGLLVAATKRVGAGDLGSRVEEKGEDEITDLARSFNQMVAEVETSRARIEYLQRIGAWQEMARRLAHEIKNPLTPIQLAVQELHRRYDGTDPAYRRLVNTSLEIVEDEVGTLRRLVSEFSGFARLPQASLTEADLGAFLREQVARMNALDDASGGDEELHGVHAGSTLESQVPEGPALACMDAQMLRRALVNLVRNAAQANAGRQRDREGRVMLRLARDGDYWVLDVEDDGPGIPRSLREAIFDPYVTTKEDGTGLGLAIVKKIIVEHGGSITADDSPLGGARLRVRLPVAGTAAARAALDSQRAA